MVRSIPFSFIKKFVFSLCLCAALPVNAWAVSCDKVPEFTRANCECCESIGGLYTRDWLCANVSKEEYIKECSKSEDTTQSYEVEFKLSLDELTDDELDFILLLSSFMND